MKNALISIGGLVVTLVILAIPVLLVCSFIYNWFDFYKFVLIIATLLDFASVGTVVICEYIDED